MFFALLIGALLSFVLAAWLVYDLWRACVRQRRRSSSTVGTIVETWEETVEGGDYERRFATVAFETPQGSHRQRTQLLRSRTAAGQRVPVLYDPADPTNFSLREPETRFETVVSFIVTVIFAIWILRSIVSSILFGVFALLLAWLSAR
jgi:hypothetical protein